jgi:carbonic anhydrase
MWTRIRVGLTTAAAALAVLFGGAPRAGADYTVSGTVTVSGGGALPNVPIQIYDQNGDLVTTAFSAANGTYSVDLSTFGANAGAYTIREAEPTSSYQQVTPTVGANSNAAAASGLIPQNGTVASTVVSGTVANPTPPTQWNYNNQPNWVTGAPLVPFETPVNLTGPTTDLSKVVTINTNDAAVQPINVQNTGAQFKFNYSGTGAQDTITTGGQTYDLSQFHFHMPSENTLGGNTQNMEFHFVYTNPATGAESVVGVFAKDGGAAAPGNSAVDAIIHNIQLGGSAFLTAPPTQTTSAGLQAVNIAQLLPGSTQGYYFYGSLTTPPLTVGVNWFVFSNPITISDAEFQLLKGLETSANFYPNNREIQATSPSSGQLSDGRRLNEVDYNVILTASANNFAAASFQLTAVPEPSSWLLMGLGAAGLGVGTVRRHRAV